MGGIRSAVAAALGVADDVPRQDTPALLDDAPGQAAAASGAAGPGQAATSGAAATAAAPGAADASLLALVDRLTALLDRSDLAELEVRAGSTGLVLRKAGVPHPADAGAGGTADPGPDGTAGGPHGASVATRSAPHDEKRAAAAIEAEGPGRPVLAPLTGIFYASPSPSAPAFVQVGQEIVVGQVIGLIEAMKLFNEIKSDRAGRVTRVVAVTGTLVKARQPLIVVEPL